jgi:hypothetical protein
MTLPGTAAELDLVGTLVVLAALLVFRGRRASSR